MFGINFIKFQPNIYALKYKNGKIVKEGIGLSFFYHAPTTSLVSIPVSGIDTPFIFKEITKDFQLVTIQGQLSFRISSPTRIAKLLNYTIDNIGHKYISDDPTKLEQRAINIVQVLTKRQLSEMTLKDSLMASDKLTQSILTGIQQNKEIDSLGLEILGLSIIAIKPNQETGRALEAKTRENILKEADDAIYERRNSSVEQERKIKENELNTEIAIENKKKDIKKTQMETEKLVQEKKQELKISAKEFEIGQEERNKKFVQIKAENMKIESDAKAYSILTTMKAYDGVDPNILQALSNMGVDAQRVISMAFQEIAKKADKIGELNISPDLLNNLLDQQPKYKK